MGLFNKLESAITNAATKISNNPFNNEIFKKYYEIVYGLLLSVGEMNYDGIKRYVEFNLNEPCTEEKLEKVVFYFTKFKPMYHKNGTLLYKLCSNQDLKSRASIDKDISMRTANILIKTNESLSEVKAYTCTRKEAYNICYKDIFESIKSEMLFALNIVSERGYKYFEEGHEKIKNKYEKMIGHEKTKELIHDAILYFYFEDNKGAKMVLLAGLDGVLYKKKSACKIASVVLRAFNFEESSKSIDEYISFSEKMCKEFVLNNDYFKSRIADHPYNQEEYSDNCIKDILNSETFCNNRFENSYLPIINSTSSWGEPEIYYADSVCNLYWKEVSSKYENGGSKNPNDVFDMICDYVKLFE